MLLSLLLLLGGLRFVSPMADSADAVMLISGTRSSGPRYAVGDHENLEFEVNVMPLHEPITVLTICSHSRSQFGLRSTTATSRVFHERKYDGAAHALRLVLMSSLISGS